MNDALLFAAHTHDGAAVTATVTTDSQSPITVTVDGERLVGQDAVVGCAIVTVCPAIVIVPVRTPPSAFAGAVTVMSPLPLPLTVAIDKKLALLCAVQVQPVCAVTGIVSAPPAASTIRLS